ncbi:MAG: molecular chaperone GroEL [Chloroflexi bacterium]|nr:molecular chaperone GroEL [Chloroflexota bacterium]MYE39408.1 molecular chaperone GroEL [Chloroflexota bacterium]
MTTNAPIPQEKAPQEPQNPRIQHPPDPSGPEPAEG